MIYWNADKPQAGIAFLNTKLENAPNVNYQSLLLFFLFFFLNCSVKSERLSLDLIGNMNIFVTADRKCD